MFFLSLSPIPAPLLLGIFFCRASGDGWCEVFYSLHLFWLFLRVCVCVCGSRLDKGAIKKRRKSRTKGCVRLYDGISWKMPSAPSQMPFDLFQQRLGLQATRWMGQGVLYGTWGRHSSASRFFFFLPGCCRHQTSHPSLLNIHFNNHKRRWP
jgi:hypothetical protein